MMVFRNHDNIACTGHARLQLTATTTLSEATMAHTGSWVGCRNTQQI